LVIGLGASVVAFVGVHALKPRFGYDDSLDVFGVHGLCGIWGALATGIFASLDVNPAGANGLLAGNPSLVVKQAIAVAACGATAGIGTFVILKAIEVFVPLRVTPDEEAAGLDIAVHGELAYDFLHGDTPARAGTPQASYASVLADEAFAEA
jgi:Amt family ammonium transporter